MRCSAAASLAGLLALSVCAGCDSSSHKTTQPPPFRPLPVRVAVTPRHGNALTTFHIRIRSRAFVGIRGHAIQNYEARIFDRSNPNAFACIGDTGPALPTTDRAPVEIVLDPKNQKGGRWCRGRFRGALSYYSDYACPARGVCRIPKGFPRKKKVVARVAFEVR